MRNHTLIKLVWGATVALIGLVAFFVLGIFFPSPVAMVIAVMTCAIYGTILSMCMLNAIPPALRAANDNKKIRHPKKQKKLRRVSM